MTIRTLVATGGHAFHRDAFSRMLDGLDGFGCTQVEQPAAQAFFRPDLASDWDAFLMYDMPGYTFHRDHSAPDLHDPPERFKTDFARCVNEGHGFVFLHHALASWPTWPEYAAVVGGRFRFAADGDKPDSGYRHGVEQHLTTTLDHPVTAGLGDGFDICDETYLAETDPDVLQLLRTSVPLRDTELWSVGNAVRGQRDSNDGWSHPPSSGVVAWIRPHPVSRIVYLQPGDGPSAFDNAGFRLLLANALQWVSAASPRRRAEDPAR
jgi:type 1 glutamine amidotransferase